MAWELLTDRSIWRDLRGSPNPLIGNTEAPAVDQLDAETRLREALSSVVQQASRPGRILEHQSHRVLVDFVSTFVEALKPAPKSILDPVCGYGMLLAASAQATQAEQVHGVEVNESPLKFAAELLDESATLVHGNFLLSDHRLLNEYDLVVADPPFGVRLDEEHAAKLVGEKTRFLNLDHALVLWTASRLAEGGSALLTVSPSFFFNNRAQRLRHAVVESGCRIAAAIHIPRESLGQEWPWRLPAGSGAR